MSRSGRWSSRALLLRLRIVLLRSLVLSLFAGAVCAQVKIPISTAVTNDWQITTWNNPPEAALAVSATPDFISVTSTRTTGGIPYSAGWTNNSPAFGPWNGVWTATYRKFKVPAEANNVKLTINAFNADDRVVLFLNDVPIPKASWVFNNSTGPGILNNGFFGQGNNISIAYPGLALPVEVTTGFNKGGDNVLKAVVNNTFSASPSATSRNLADVGDGTAFLMVGELSYDVAIAGIEITQATQEYQALADFKMTLASTREPPVPIVASKPAVIRVYLSELTEVSTYKIQLSGAVNDTKSVTTQPGCKPDDQRRQARACASVDFYFTPDPGPWDLQVKLLKADDTVIETHNLPLKSRSARGIVLKAVGVCDDFSVSRSPQWLCTPAGAAEADLAANLDLLTKIAPTDSVKVEPTGNWIYNNFGVPQRYPLPGGEYYDVWEYNVLLALGSKYGIFDDLLGLTATQYVGVFRANVPANRYSSANGATLGVTVAAAPPERHRPSLLFLHDPSAAINTFTVAHEGAHEFGLSHTAVAVPVSDCRPAAGAAWPYPDSTIQEVGFDVAARKPKLPADNFDVMGYCTPGRAWISPFNYRNMLMELDRGVTRSVRAAQKPRTVTSVRSAPVAPALATPRFWTISGTITSGILTLDPLFDDAAAASTAASAGTHRIEFRNTADAIVAIRPFTPVAAGTTSPLVAATSVPLAFSEQVPVLDGVSRIVVSGPYGAILGSVSLDAPAPTVALASIGPMMTGTRDINWTGPVSVASVSRLSYSSDGGATWAALGEVTGLNTLPVNFDVLPGGSASRLRVSVSNGGSPGTAVSGLFTVPRKPITTANIVSPRSGDVFPPRGLVRLAAYAFDPEDRVLDGSAIRWESSAGGLLGTGAVLNLYNLQLGAQLVTMTATDSDGNTQSRSVPITVAGARPLLNMAVTGADQRPARCVTVALDAASGSAGVDLSSLAYSLDGARTWTSVPTRTGSYRFTVSMVGEIDLVARAVDAAGQATLKQAKFTVNGPCAVNGAPKIEAVVTRVQTFFEGVVQVLVNLKNTGQGVATASSVTALRAQTLSGSGEVSIYRLTAGVPINVRSLGVGEFVELVIYVSVPPTVTRFSLTEDLVVHGNNNAEYRSSLGQAIVAPSP
jgi:hypothetical protein